MYKLKEVVEHFSTAAKETIQKIKHHYGWFSLMFLLEILFLLSFVGIFVYYQINLAFNQEQLFSLMEQANLNATQLQDGGTFMTNQAISSLIGPNTGRIRGQAAWLPCRLRRSPEAFVFHGPRMRIPAIRAARICLRHGIPWS